MKYELTNETQNYFGTTLYRIRALKNFGDVFKGDLGGWVESGHNLSHIGDCWVYDEALVYDEARVCGEARVYGKARVYGEARVSITPPRASRSDCYDFIAVPCDDGEIRVIAGCRYFTFPEARKHWADTRGGTPLGDETQDILDFLEKRCAVFYPKQ